MLPLSVVPRATKLRPSTEELRALTERMPNCRVTRYGNVNVQTRVLARSKSSTCVVTDEPGRHSGLTIGRAEGERVARAQDEFIRSRDMLVVDGYIGNDPLFRTPARLIIEQDAAKVCSSPHSPQLTRNALPRSRKNQ